MALPTTGPAAYTNPDVFRGSAGRRYDPFPVLSGTAYSSHAPATTWFHPVFLQEPLYVANVNVFKSLNASLPQATSQNSSGSEGFSYVHGLTVFTRQDYGANSTNLTTFLSNSFGLTATMTYSSSSQTVGISWNTDATGGTSAYTTTSADGNWTSFATGPKAVQIPLAAYFSIGEYWFAHGHSTTALTSNSSVVMLSVSNLHIAPQVQTFGILGGSVTLASAGVHGIAGPASAVTTSSTMPGSVITASLVNFWVQNLGP